MAKKFESLVGDTIDLEIPTETNGVKGIKHYRGVCTSFKYGFGFGFAQINGKSMPFSASNIVKINGTRVRK